MVENYGYSRIYELALGNKFLIISVSKLLLDLLVDRLRCTPSTLYNIRDFRYLNRLRKQTLRNYLNISFQNEYKLSSI